MFKNANYMHIVFENMQYLSFKSNKVVGHGTEIENVKKIDRFEGTLFFILKYVQPCPSKMWAKSPYG